MKASTAARLLIRIYKAKSPIRQYQIFDEYTIEEIREFTNILFQVSFISNGYLYKNLSE